MDDELTSLISAALDSAGYETSKENVNAVYLAGLSAWDWDQCESKPCAIVDAIELSAAAGNLERVDA